MSASALQQKLVPYCTMTHRLACSTAAACCLVGMQHVRRRAKGAAACLLVCLLACLLEHMSQRGHVVAGLCQRRNPPAHLVGIFVELGELDTRIAVGESCCDAQVKDKAGRQGKAAVRDKQAPTA